MSSPSDSASNSERAASSGGVAGRLLRQSGLYAIGNASLKAGGLLLALLYLNPAYLTVQQFGYFGLLMVTAQLATFVVGLGMGTGLLKHMTDTAYAAEHPALPATALLATVGSASVWIVLIWSTAVPIAEVLLDDGGRALLVRLIGVYVALKVVGMIPLTLLRVRERAGWYALTLIGEMLLLIAAAYVLMVGFGMGLAGLLWAHVGAAGSSTLALVGAQLWRTEWLFHPRVLGTLIRFGVPLVMASLATWLLNVGDRYLIKWLRDAESVGLYEWAARLGSVLNLLVVQSFHRAFMVIGLKVQDAEPSGTLHRETFRHFSALAGWAVLGLALFSYELTLLLPADPLYLEAADLVLLIALGFMANGVYYIIVNIIYGRGRTTIISVNVVGAAVLNVGLNLVLIPALGVMGAALATLVSYVVLAVGAAYITRHDAAFRFPWGLFAGMVAVVVVLYAGSSFGDSWGHVARLSLKVGLFAMYPFVLIVLRLYRTADVRMLKEQIAAMVGAGNTEGGPVS